MAIEDTARGERRNIFNLGKTLIGEAQTLVRQEIALARQEMVGKIVRDVKAAGLLIAAGVVLLLSLFVFIFMEIADLISYLLGSRLWAGLLITWLIFTIIFGILAYVEVRRLVVPKPERTIGTLKEDLEWAKQQLKRSGR